MKTNIALRSDLIEKPKGSKSSEIQYPAYAVKSDDGERPKRTNILAYALKSDDG